MSAATARKTSASKRERKPKLRAVHESEEAQLVMPSQLDQAAVSGSAAMESGRIIEFQSPGEFPPFSDDYNDDAEEVLDDLHSPAEDEDDALDDAALDEAITPEVAQRQAPLQATLVAHAGAQRISRDELLTLPLPETTSTFKPIPHHELISQLEEALAFSRISVVREEFAATQDGMRLFGLLELNAEYEGVRFAIALRNANDKSMRLGMVAGYRVFVCDNMAMSGDFKPLLAKHSKNLDLTDSIALGVHRIQRGFAPLREAIEFKRQTRLSDEQARSLIYQAFLVNKFPLRAMKAVHREYFVAPSFEEFSPRTVWSLENAFTSAFKSLQPIAQFEMTARLGRFLLPHSQAL